MVDPEVNIGLDANLQAKPGKPPTPQDVGKMHFTAADLYGGGGRPRSSDIEQDSLGDCYFVATLSAVAGRQPDVIRNMIAYHARSDTFKVTLHDGDRASKTNPTHTITVTQAELRDNILRGGGSRIDNFGKGEPAWPAVMETAFAKLNDPNTKDGLAEGYRKINGGQSYDAVITITGQRSQTQYPAAIEKAGLEATMRTVQKALDDGRPVMLSTDPEQAFKVTQPPPLFGILPVLPRMDPVPQDKLVDDHVYTLERIYKEGGEIKVDLRNPWGHNRVAGEAEQADGSFPKSADNAVVTVRLKDLVEGGGLEHIDIGQPKVQTLGKTAAEAAAAGLSAGASNKSEPAPQQADPVALRQAMGYFTADERAERDAQRVTATVPAAPPEPAVSGGNMQR